MRTNRSVRFGFGGSTVLVVSHGHTVSFNTTSGGRGWVERSSSNGTINKQRRYLAPLFNSEHLPSKRLGSIVRTFE